jgi:DNA-binding transcriptional LysR family regulator
MELRQLEYFVAVAEEGSFTRAAARLFVAQPGVSSQIRRLERELGEELLDRSGRAVRLTAAGAAVLPHARAAIDGAASMRLVVEELSGLTRGRIALGIVTSCRGLNLPELLASFHKEHPGVEITLTEMHSDMLVKQLRARELDAAIIGLAETVPSGIGVQVVVAEPLVLAVSHSDPLARHDSLPLLALKEQPLVSLPQGTGIRSCLEESCAKAGFQPRVAFEASALGLLAELAIRGLGPALLPASVADEYAESLKLIAVTRPELRARLAFSWCLDGPISPAARAFTEYARGALGD